MSKRQDSSNAGEARCDLLGDLAARAAEERPPDLRQWAEIEQALARGPGFWRRRWFVLVLPALAGLALSIAAGQTLGHKLQGCSLASDGSFSVSDDRECVVTFDEGSRITLGKATRGRLHELWFRRGAQLTLQSGRADLSVVHRADRRWEVLAEPFQVRVTGTRFEVGWAPERGRFSLAVSQGEVSVNGGPLRDRTVRAGRRLDVNTVTGDATEGDLSPSVQATAAAVRTGPAEIREKPPADAEAAPAPAARSERKRGLSIGKPAIRNPPPAAKAEPPVPEPPVAAIEPAARDWTASFAADDESPPEAPGPRRLTVGDNGKLAGEAAGSVFAIGGERTRFSASAGSSPEHLYLEDGMLCTRGRISALACADEKIPTMRCDWATNWGVLIQWHPRSDGQAWGSGAASSIAMEYRGKASHYRLVAHREGDPADRMYCIENYRSGRTVAPSQFRSQCWTSAGVSLPDFTKIDYFSLQVASEETPLRFRFCLSAISLF